MRIEDANGVLIGESFGVTTRHRCFVTVPRGLPTPAVCYLDMGSGIARGHRTALYSESEDFSEPLYAPLDETSPGFVLQNCQTGWRDEHEVRATPLFYVMKPDARPVTIHARSIRPIEEPRPPYLATDRKLRAMEVMPVELVSGGRFEAPLRITDRAT